MLFDGLMIFIYNDSQWGPKQHRLFVRTKAAFGQGHGEFLVVCHVKLIEVHLE